MSYAYFQGQEAQALDYYKKLLELATDPKAKSELTTLVEKLAKAIEEQEQQQSGPHLTVQNMSAA